MMRKWGLVLSVLVAAALVLSACGEGSKKGAGADFKIGLVTDVGGIDDKSFNQSAWDGLERVKKDTGAATKFLESKGEADMEPNLNNFVKEGYSLTWGIGFLFQDAMTKVAKQNPDAKLALIDNEIDLPNVSSVMFAENEGAFLVGVVAGLMTKSGKIGFVGGMDIPVIHRFDAGFEAGIKAVNPNAEILKNYVGEFMRPDLGKQAAATLYDNGADIVFQAAGNSGTGVFNEARERKDAGKDVWVIGVDKDQSIDFGDDITLTSMMKGVEQAVYKVSKDFMDGNFEGGKVVTLGLKDDGVGLPQENKNVPEDVLKKVDEYKQKIIKGEIVVPTAPAGK
ncbi:BMP family ABC transporter substrate-binding protein [Paenibacillus sp. NPDC058071]|uniref:BMP family lipoprotein n=1 Tax=Paenibacillus sp. NPDC058071 TaxID=3346326 RepID=UPI0036DB232B